MTVGYSVAQTARLVCHLRWVCGRLSAIFAAWSTQVAMPTDVDESADEVAATTAAQNVTRLHSAGRLLKHHRTVLDGLQPDSVRMADWHDAAPASAGLEAVLNELAATPGPAPRWGAALNVLVSDLAAAYDAICQHSAAHSDAALASAATSLRNRLAAQLARPRDADQLADADPAGTADPAEAVAQTLAAVGGLVPADLLRPKSFA